MENANKAEKLAAAKKKLKKFQKKGRSHSPRPSEVAEPAADSVTKTTTEPVVESAPETVPEPAAEVSVESTAESVREPLSELNPPSEFDALVGDLVPAGEVPPQSQVDVLQENVKAPLSEPETLPQNHDEPVKDEKAEAEAETVTFDVRSHLTELTEEVVDLRSQLEAKKSRAELLERQLDDERRLSERLQRQLAAEAEELRLAGERLEEKNVQSERLERQLKADAEELRSAREELSRNASTVEILIEEKNDLSIGQNQLRSQVGALEHQLAVEQAKAKDLIDRAEAAEEAHRRSEATVAALQLQLQQSAEQLRSKSRAEELLAEGALELQELRLRHAHQTSELGQRDLLVKELQSQLELAQVHLQQMKNAGGVTAPVAADVSAAEQAEQLASRAEKLEQETLELREQLTKAVQEKDLVAQQYQQYIQRLNGQIRTLRSQGESQSVERRNVEVALELTKERAAELEAMVLGLQKEREAAPKERQPAPKEPLLQRTGDADAAAAAAAAAVDDGGPDESQLQIRRLQAQVAESALNNEQLAKLIGEKEALIQELEIRVERVQTELKTSTGAHQTAEERQRLLQAMQNDKVAASRAISQNRQLKMQLEELEKAFIQLSNDKLALTEALQGSQRRLGDAAARLQTLEPEAADLRVQVAELAGQRDATIYWRQELQEAHERIQALSHQNGELKKRVIWNVAHLMQDTQHRPSKNEEPRREPRPEPQPETPRVGPSQPEPSSAPQTQPEPAREEPSTETRPDPSVEASQSGPALEEQPGDQISQTSGDGCEDSSRSTSPSDGRALREDYEQLLERYQRAVDDVAALTAEKQHLEHLVLQLQSETETIGEYVSLYQVQRGLLRQRAEQLALERRALQERVRRLTRLLPRLAPQLDRLPQWLRLAPRADAPHGDGDDDDDDDDDDDGDYEVVDEAKIADFDREAAAGVADILREMTASSTTSAGQGDDDVDQGDPFGLSANNRPPHDNFHPCHCCSGQLMTV